MSSDKKDNFKRGFEVGGYRFERRIGKGGYGVIFVVRQISTGKLCALKIEQLPSHNRGLTPEIRFMRELSGSPYFPHILDSGEDSKYRWYCMELLGPSLALAKFESPKGRFRKWTGLFVAKEMLRGIEDLHRRGYVHRDIKPGNFLLRPDREHPVVLIDFGLGRKYMNPETGELFPCRENVGFVGTSRYASLNVHEKKEPGRQDDLISWWFSFLEISVRSLPWPHTRDKQVLLKSKRKHCTPERLSKKLPPECRQICEYILSLTYETTPDYEMIYHLLDAAREKVTQRECLDWETVDVKDMKKISAIDMRRDDDVVVFDTKKEIDGPNLHLCSVQ